MRRAAAICPTVLGRPVIGWYAHGDCSADRSVFVVVVIAGAVGLVLGHRAGAVVEHRALRSVAAAIAAPVAAIAGAPAASGPSHDEGEPDEPRANATGDNPYEEAPPVHPVASRIVVPVRDGMLRLPGGHFTMGSASAKAPPNERPVRAMTVAPYWIDRTEVTVAAYRACVQTGNCAAAGRASATCTYDADESGSPDFVRALGRRQGYCRFVGKRSAERDERWEFAARGSFAVPFPWGSARTAPMSSP